jgi:hypothetical protein
MAVLNVEELERQAIETFVAATTEEAAVGVPGGSPGMPGAARAKKAAKPGAKKKGANGNKKQGGSAIESELNVYGLEWGLGVAAGSALVDFLYFRYGLLGDIITSLFGGSLTLFFFIFLKILFLGIGLYLAAWMIDEQRYPAGNILIITGLQSWVPQLGYIAWGVLAWMTGLGIELAMLMWLAQLWMVVATFAIYKGLLETENEGFILMLVVISGIMNWYMQAHAYEVASQVAEVFETIAKALGLA